MKDTDLDVLRERAYADAGNLDDRRSVYVYREPQIDFLAWVLDGVPLESSERVLDLGCGPGQYLDRLVALRGPAGLVGADLSEGMLAEARGVAPGVPLACLDATLLPFADDTFAVVLANHMLYHVPDASVAAAEVRRVLQPGGMLRALTNSELHVGELVDALAAVSGRDDWFRPGHRFTLENGEAQLAGAFDHIEVRRVGGVLHVPSAAPLVRYADSMRALSTADRPYTDAAWAELLRDLEARIAERIAAEGEFRVTTSSGLFLCH